MQFSPVFLFADLVEWSTMSSKKRTLSDIIDDGTDTIGPHDNKKQKLGLDYIDISKL